MQQNQTKQELETLLDLFEHDGWKLFIEDNERLNTSLKENAYLDCNTNDEWQQRRGAITILSSLVSFESTTKFIYEQSQEDSDALQDL